MIRTTVYLDEDDTKKLAELGARSGTTEAELIRRRGAARGLRRGTPPAALRLLPQP